MGTRARASLRVMYGSYWGGRDVVLILPAEILGRGGAAGREEWRSLFGISASWPRFLDVGRGTRGWAIDVGGGDEERGMCDGSRRLPIVTLSTVCRPKSSPHLRHIPTVCVIDLTQLL